MSKVKISYGIALCNRDLNNNIELLLIKKRYTYHFFSFIFAYYKKNNNKYLKYLFDNMTCPEKIDILGMQFSNMWYRIWLTNPEKHFNIKDIYETSTIVPKNKICVKKEPHDIYKLSAGEAHKLYFNKKNKFDKNFMSDGGSKLQHIINTSNDSEILWEIPKGGKKEDETNIDCAIREFYEETSIKYKDYRILYHIPPVEESFKDNGVVYKNIYYIAVLRHDNNCKNIKIDFKSLNQISEVEQVKWVSINEIKFMNLNKTQSNKLINLYKRVIFQYKKYISLKTI